MQPANGHFDLPITVGQSDIDALGHVNNVAYLRWVQDAAVAHWRHAALPQDQEALLWVVVRHEIDYKRPAFLHEALIARTWVGAATRRAFDRHTQIVRASDGRILAQARTIWCPIDRKTGKPTDVRDEVRQHFSVPSEPTTP